MHEFPVKATSLVISNTTAAERFENLALPPLGEERYRLCNLRITQEIAVEERMGYIPIPFHSLA